MTSPASRLGALLGPCRDLCPVMLLGRRDAKSVRRAKVNSNTLHMSAKARMRGKTPPGAVTLTPPTSEVITCPSELWGSARGAWRALWRQSRSQSEQGRGWRWACSPALMRAMFISVTVDVLNMILLEGKACLS